jgi:tetratricopeptide (TPR) repeat protein
MKIGVPLVLQQDLASAYSVSPSLVATESNASQLGSQDVLRTKIESRQGKIHIEATLFDLASQKNTATNHVQADSLADLLSAVNTLAKRIDEHASDFSTKNVEVIKDFASAAQNSNPQQKVDLLQKTVATDHSFGLGYLLLVEMLSSVGPQATKPVIDQAQANRNSFTPIDQARWILIMSRVSREPLGKQSLAAESVLKVAPNDLDALALVGGIKFLSGDGSGGDQAMSRAIALSPNNANLQGQYAQGLLESKRFKDAENILAKIQNSPAVLSQLASCILLQGDVVRAGTVAEQFLKSVNNAELQTVLRGSWLEVTGQRQKALDLLETTKFTNLSVKAIALGEAAIFRFRAKDVEGAKKASALALAADNRPGSFSSVVNLLINANLPAPEWRKQVEAAGLSPQVKEPVIGYGLFLNGHFDDAAQAWRQILDHSNGTDLRARAMLASSLDKAGKAGEAQKLKVLPFALEFGDLYGAISFDEMRRLTGLPGK